MATSTGRGRDGTSRVLTKLKTSIDNGNYYEAHQMYRTLYFRYTSQGKFTECARLMFSGATTLLNHSQIGSGSDLALLYLETLLKSTLGASSSHLDEITALHQLLPPHCPERLQFSSQALKFVQNSGSDEQLSQLHRNLALTLWHEKNFGQSRYHFLRSTDGEKCAAMLIECSVTQGFKSEVDLFIAQAVFQYLCLRNKQTATVVFYTYTAKHPNIQPGPPFLLPLLNFLWFLLLAVEGGKLTVFTVLCEQYQKSLSRDPSYKEYLDRIGQIFFGLPKPQRQSNMLDNLLHNLMGGFGVSDSEDGGGGPGDTGLMSEDVD